MTKSVSKCLILMILLCLHHDSTYLWIISYYNNPSLTHSGYLFLTDLFTSDWCVVTAMKRLKYLLPSLHRAHWGKGLLAYDESIYEGKDCWPVMSLFMREKDCWPMISLLMWKGLLDYDKSICDEKNWRPMIILFIKYKNVRFCCRFMLSFSFILISRSLLALTDEYEDDCPFSVMTRSPEKIR